MGLDSNCRYLKGNHRNIPRISKDVNATINLLLLITERPPWLELLVGHTCQVMSKCPLQLVTEEPSWNYQWVILFRR